MNKYMEGLLSAISFFTIMAYGIMVSFALTAAEQLKSRGIDARVVNMSSIKDKCQNCYGNYGECHFHFLPQAKPVWH